MDKVKVLLNIIKPGIIFLAIFIALMNIWATNHLESLGWYKYLINILVLSYSAYVILYGLLNMESSEVKSVVKNSVQKIISLKGLVIVYGIFTLIILLVSSITFISKEPVNITLKDSNNEIIFSSEVSDQQVSLLQFIYPPYSKKYYISSNGYKEKAISVFPWFNTNIDLSKELKPHLTALIRLPEVKEVYQNGTVIITLSNDTITQMKIPQSTGAFFLGKKREIPEQWEEQWMLYLQEKQAPANIMNEVMGGWNTPAFAVDNHFNEGDDLNISILNGQQIPIAGKRIKLTQETLQDYLIDIL
ncbi:MAG: hypothetical protein ACNS60_15905 [Candidatus Cyclobacteriaceae bacterium M2_1C_046]